MYLHICSRNLSDIPIKLLFTSLMFSKRCKDRGYPPRRSRKCIFRFNFRFKAFSLLAFLGGGPEERGRAQIRPSLYGAARVHRGVCSCARCLSTDGTRHGGSQKVPLSCESVCCSLCSVSIQIIAH